MISSHKQAFELLIETKLAVQAADEGSARRKVERLLGQVRALEPDVRTTGQVWIYGDDANQQNGRKAKRA